MPKWFATMCNAFLRPHNFKQRAGWRISWINVDIHKTLNQPLSSDSVTTTFIWEATPNQLTIYKFYPERINHLHSSRFFLFLFFSFSSLLMWTKVVNCSGKCSRLEAISTPLTEVLSWIIPNFHFANSNQLFCGTALQINFYKSTDRRNMNKCIIKCVSEKSWSASHFHAQKVRKFLLQRGMNTKGMHLVHWNGCRNQ